MQILPIHPFNETVKQTADVLAYAIFTPSFQVVALSFSKGPLPGVRCGLGSQECRFSQSHTVVHTFWFGSVHMIQARPFLATETQLHSFCWHCWERKIILLQRSKSRVVTNESRVVNNHLATKGIS